jgi:hypothetical protein
MLIVLVVMAELLAAFIVVLVKKICKLRGQET